MDTPLGIPFPKNFRDTVKTIVRRLFRVYAHIYSSHFDHICALGIEGSSHKFVTWVANFQYYFTAHLNTSYRHFFLFINEVCASSILHNNQPLMDNPTSLTLLTGRNSPHWMN